MATASEIKLTEVYIGLLGRAPDPEGLAYWVKEYDGRVAAGEDSDIALKKITNDFTLQTEWDSGLGANVTKTTVDGVVTLSYTKTQADAVVNGMYQNLFEKTGTAAPPPADVKYWSDQLQDGSVTASEMSVLLVLGAGATDTATLALKTEAATYYVGKVSQADYKADKSTATVAVDTVAGPLTLQSSKDATDAISTGTGKTHVLTVGTDEPAMTGGDDTITGTNVGTGSTYTAADIIVDGSVGDSDKLTITSDTDLTFGTITKVEAVNINYSEQLGAGMTLTDISKVTSSTINLTAAGTVDISGVTVTGETVVAAGGSALTSNLNTEGVTSLTVLNGAASSVTIAGDAKLATIQVNGIDSNDTIISTKSVGTTTTATDIDLDGTAATNDVASVSAAGEVNLDVSDADVVEKITLSGNGAAVDFAVAGFIGGGAGAVSDMTYTMAGDQAITISAPSVELNGASIVNGGTGTLAIDVTGTPGNLDLTGVTLAGGLDISGDTGATTAVTQVGSGTTVSITATQTDGTLTFDANDTANDSELSITLSTNDAHILKTADFDKVTIATGDAARVIDAITMGANDAEVSIIGTNDITITAASTSGQLTVSGQKVNLTSTQDVDGDLKVTGTNDVTLGAAATVDNDVAIESATAVSYKDITSTNGDIVVKGDSVSSDKKLLADNDITITATNDVSLSEADAMVADATTGSITISGKKITATDHIDAQNDVTITGTNDVIVEQVTATTGSITISGTGLTNTGALTAAAGNITLTASNDAFTSDIDSSVTASAGTLTLADGKFDATGGIVLLTGNKIVVSGDTDVVAGNFVAESITVTSTNDVTLSTVSEQTASDGVVLSAGAATGKITATTGTAAGTITMVTGSGNDVLTANEDAVTNIQSGLGNDNISVADVKANSVINGEGGADSFTLRDDDTVYTVAGGAGNDTFDVVVVDATTVALSIDGGDDTDKVIVNGNYTASTGFALKNIEVVEMTANTTLAGATLSNDSLFELKGAHTLAVATAAGAGVANTIDISAMTTSTLAVPTGINLVGNSGDDALTGALNAANTLITSPSGTNTLTGGNGIDTIVGGSGIDTINGLDGADIINGLGGADIITAGGGADIITAGLGLDTIALGAGGDVDTIIMTTGGAIAVDKVSGFVVAAGEDELQVDFSDVSGLVAQNLQLSDASADVGAVATSVGVVTIAGAGAHDFGATAAHLTTITGATAYTEATLETHIEANGTSGGTLAGDAFLVAYDDTANTYIAYVLVNTTAANGALLADVTVVNILELTGVANAETFLTTSFAYV